MSVHRVLDKLETYVHEGTWLPAGYRVLSEERLVEYIEKIRSTLPEEVGRAKIIAKDKDRVIRAAQEQAQAIVNEAGTAHDQSEVLKRARSSAESVIRSAEEQAQKIREGADQYAAQVLGELENRLSGALGSVRKGREALTPSRPANGVQVDGPLAEAAAKNKRAAFDAQAADETAALEPFEFAKK